MIHSKRLIGVAALAIASLTFASLVPAAAFAENRDNVTDSSLAPISENSLEPLDIIKVQPVEGGFTYQLQDDASNTPDTTGPTPRLLNIGTGCQGAYLLRKVNNYIEWGASNNCTKVPAAKYLPWYIVGKLQRAKVGTSSYSTVQGPFQTNDTWGKYGALATNFSCLGNKNYTYRVVWQVRYIGVTTEWWPSDSKTIACT